MGAHGTPETLLNTTSSKIWRLEAEIGPERCPHSPCACDRFQTLRQLCTVSNKIEEAEWRAPVHTAVASLKKTLKALGWEEMCQFAWQQQQAGYIEMEAGPGLVKKVQHQIRESFRQKCWTQFFERTKRHEIQAMDTFPQYSSNGVKQIQQIASRGGIQAALVTGRIRSPACVQRYQHSLVSKV